MQMPDTPAKNKPPPMAAEPNAKDLSPKKVPKDNSITIAPTMI
jgi:hypothetical protein